MLKIITICVEILGEEEHFRCQQMRALRLLIASPQRRDATPPDAARHPTGLGAGSSQGHDQARPEEVQVSGLPGFQG